jgi:ATP-dependent helicase/nuclease subunit A
LSVIVPDLLQRKKALDPERSYIVQAPAGSGKTSILVQRYLRLLSAVDRPEAVLAMTFTRKAAAEMRDRVLDALNPPEPVLEPTSYQRETRELAEAVLERDRALGWNLLTNTGRLQIQTIDSLCAFLVRQMPIGSGLGAAPEVIEHAEELYHDAARQTLKRMAEGDAETQELFRRVALHFDNNLGMLEIHIVRMLEKREQWRLPFSTSDSATVQAFCELLRLARENLAGVFRAAAKVDFTEITRAAINALGTPEAPSDLLYWLDYRIQHILVDEFQDTSQSQYDLVKALTEQWSEGDNRTLFVVGDPMQSIYRFREAEVGLFLQCWDDRQLGAVRLERIELTANFRSTPKIVGWIQDIFTPIFSEDNKGEGAVKLRPAHAVQAVSGLPPQVIPFVNDEDGCNEAREVVQLVESARRDGDVGILVRSRNQLSAILPALRQAGINYEAVDIDQLREQQHIIDLLSLTRAIVHLGDRAAWLACLRAPWCGLSLADMSAVAEQTPQKAIFDRISHPDAVSGLSGDGRARLEKLLTPLRSAVDSVGRIGLRDLVETTWIALGGPALLTESQKVDAQTFFDVIEQHEEAGLIRDFGFLNERLEFLFARPVTGPDCVKIMTVHTAKGLEFDTVILPRLGKQTQGNDKDMLIWTEQIQADGRAHFLVAAKAPTGQEDPQYDLIDDLIDRKEQHETKRLFYVAATRARKQLFLLGGAKTKKEGLQTPSSGTFLRLIWDRFQEDFLSEMRRKHWHQGNLFADARTPQTILQRLPAQWRLPQFDEPVQWEPRFQRSTASAGHISFDWVSDTGRHVGSLVHEFLKRIASEGTELWKPARLQSLKALVSSELLRLGVSRAEEPEASGRVFRALENTLSSERGKWILAQRRESRSELAVGGTVGRQLVSGTVDRMFRDNDGRIWIIDFKTSEHEGSRREDFLDEQQKRYSSQLETYAVLLSRMMDGPISLGLYFPLLDAWREWAFERESALTAS